MKRSTAQQIVTVLSIIALVLGLAWTLVDRVRHVRPALISYVLLAYGGVFIVFLFFDTVGRQASKLRAEADGARPRPAPVPGIGGRRVAPVRSSATPVPELRLERVSADQRIGLQTLLDAAVRELLALEDRRPTLDADGHVTEADASEWLETSGLYPFFMFVDTSCAGCCALEQHAGQLTVRMLYVDPAWRRRHIGTSAIAKLADFARLATVESALSVTLPDVNHRARRFVEACGFQRQFDADAGSDAPETQRHWRLPLR